MKLCCVRGSLSAAVVFLVFGSLHSTGQSRAVNQQTTLLTAQELFRRVAPSVFIVEALDEDAAVVAIGSGVAVKSDEIVTNIHVIDPGVRFRARQGEKTWPAELRHVDIHSDLCLLQVDGLQAPVVPVRPAGTVAVGERVYTIGAPEGLELTLSEGLISGLRDMEGQKVIQTTAAISHGSSGGGLFDASARLVGITTFVLTGGQNLNFALPVNSVLEPQPERYRLAPNTIIPGKRITDDTDLIQRHVRPRTNYEEAESKLGKDLIDSALLSARLAELDIKRNPGDWKAHFDLGSSVSWWDKHRAVVELSEAVRLMPEGAEARAKLGVELDQVGDVYGAIPN
jgi:hypothetical protein